jgi:hypothetical protein
MIVPFLFYLRRSVEETQEFLARNSTVRFRLARQNRMA